MTVHGDDFTSCGTERELKWVEASTKAEFELTTRYLGPDVDKHEQELRILNRVIGWGDSNITYEADQRHAEIIIRGMGLENAKAVTTPGSREEAAISSITAEDIGAPVLDPEDPEARGDCFPPAKPQPSGHSWLEEIIWRETGWIFNTRRRRRHGACRSRARPTGAS